MSLDVGSKTAWVASLRAVSVGVNLIYALKPANLYQKQGGVSEIAWVLSAFWLEFPGVDVRLGWCLMCRKFLCLKAPNLSAMTKSG